MSSIDESPNAAQDPHSNPTRPPPAARERREWLVVAGVLVMALALLLGSVFFLPGFIVERDLGPGAQLPATELVNAKNNVRSTLLQAIAGLVLVLGAIAAWRQLKLGREQFQASREQIRRTEEFTSRQLEISERGQVTERFTRAIEQLASDNIYLRIGGVYGLELLAAQSAVDKETIAEILLHLVHQRSPWPPREGQEFPADTRIDKLPSLWRRAADVADAVRVVGRLPVPKKMRHIFYLGSLDLRRAYLQGADLGRAYLGKGNLARAELQDANMRGAKLEFTILAKAELDRACLEEADLEWADLRDVDLRGAKLKGARFNNATANQYTQWPVGFDWEDAGVNMKT